MRKETIVNILIALASVLGLVWIIPAQTPAYPGYGVPASLVPNVATGFILFLALLSLGRSAVLHLMARRGGEASSDRERPVAEADRVHPRHLALFMIPCVLLMPAMQWGGFIPAGIAFMLLIQFLCGQRKPLPLALVSIGAVGVMYATMMYGLGVPMP